MKFNKADLALGLKTLARGAQLPVDAPSLGEMFGNNGVFDQKAANKAAAFAKKHGCIFSYNEYGTELPIFKNHFKMGSFPG